MSNVVKLPLLLIISATVLAAELPELKPAALLGKIDQARREGRTKLVIPAGTYRISASAEEAHLTIRKLRDFEIDATNVTLVLTTPDRFGIIFSHCANVTFRGLTLRRQTLPYSQGHIVGVSADRQAIEVQVATGYPTRFTDGSLPVPPPTYVFDPKTRQWKEDTTDIYPKKLEPLGEGRFRLRLSHALPATMPVGVGDLLAWRGVGRSDIRLDSCEKMQLLDVTVAGGSGFCFHEANGDGHNYYRVNVTYPPRPEGAVEDPLIASNADAFHSRGVRAGPTLERCRLEGMPDDGIAIHGSYGLVVSAEDQRLLLDAHAGFLAQTGDHVRFFDQRGVDQAEAIVTAVAVGTPIPNYPKTSWRRFADASEQTIVQLTLDRAINAFAGDLISNADASGSGFTVRDCVIRHHRARGMLLKADRGLVEHNLVEGSTMGGIVVSPEMGYWNEADYSRELVLRENTIRRVGIWRQESNPMAGALSVAAYEAGRYVPRPGGHRHITIEGNVFEDNDGPNILLTSSRDVRLRGNRFVRPMHQESSRGERNGIRPGVLIETRECDDVVIEDNQVIDAGGAFRMAVGPSLPADVR